MRRFYNGIRQNTTFVVWKATANWQIGNNGTGVGIAGNGYTLNKTGNSSGAGGLAAIGLHAPGGAGRLAGLDLRR
jgi:hypothetical protein